MSVIDTTAYWFGTVLLTLIAVATAATLAYFIFDFIGKEVFKRMRRVYHLSSIAYWLTHMERRGHKCFLDPETSGDGGNFK